LEEGKRRYGIHPLTRAFAREHLKEQGDFERLSRLRSAKYFLEFAQGLVGREYHTPASKQAYDVLEVERGNILSVMDWCYESEQWQLFIDLTIAMVHFLGRRGFWHERILNVKRAIEAAHHAKSEHNDEAEMWLSIDALGWVYLEQNRLDEAAKSIKEGQIIAERYSNPCGIALAHYYLARAARARGQESLAVQVALDGLSAKCNDLNILAHLHNELGNVAAQRGDYDEAIKQFKQALTITEGLEAGKRIGHWGPMTGLAEALSKLGKYSEARQYFEEVLRTAGEVKAFMARAKLGLAFVEESEGQYAKALNLAQEAAKQFEQLGIENRMAEAWQLVQRCQTK
jgi:LuxR family glucitol operon transcriptional activator